MVLDERDSRLGALDYIFVFPSYRRLGNALRLFDAVGFGDGYLLSDYYVTAVPYGKAYYQAEKNLKHQLCPLAYSALVVLEYLDIVVGESETSAPDGGEDKQLYIDIGKVAEQQRRDQDGQDDDHASH